jgi:hypothetical protein
MADLFAAVMLCETAMEQSLAVPPQAPHAPQPGSPGLSVVNGHAQK